MGRASVTGKCGWAAASLAGAVAAILALAPAASAQSPNVNLLRSPGCPPTYKAIDRKVYDSAEQETALDALFQPDNFFKAVRLRPPVDWKQDPFHSKHWRNALNAFKWMDSLIYIYNRGGSDAIPALIQARDLVADWTAANNNPSRGVAKEAWLDKTVGDRTPYMAFIARASACEGLLSESQAAVFNSFLQLQGNRLESDKRYSPSNRGLFEDFGLYLLSEYAPYLQNAAAWHALAPPRFRDTFHGRLDEKEGGWLEHSPGYQLLVVRTVEKFFAQTGQDGDLLGFLPRMKDAVAWLLMPDGALPQFGDTYRDKLLPKWATDRARGKQGMHVFKRTGYAVVKQGQNYFAMTSQFHNTDHKHADDLSFELFDGRRVITDSGVYDKDIGRYRLFARSTEAHSVLTVDGEEWKLKPRSTFGSGIAASGKGKGWYAVEGVNPLLRRQKVSHHRLFLYKPGTALIVIDRVRAKKKHRYTRYFHFGPDINLNKSGKGLQLSGGGPKGLLETGGHLSLVRAQEDPLQGWTFPAFRTRVKRWSAAYKSRDRNADYVTTFSLNPNRPVSAKLRGKMGKKVDLKLKAAGKSAGRLAVKRGRKLKIR
jgi:Heparinase II/III-like protein/Heparinase II/III N-terminus